MSYWNDYHTPATVAEALALRQHYGPRAELVAGGTDLILELQFGGRPAVEALIDVTQIAGLDAIRQEDDWIVLGAAVTHAQIERHPLLIEHGQALVESCSVVGGPQVRNVATLGGNVAHALPAADGTIGLLALEAEVQLCTLTAGGVAAAWQPLLSIFAGPGRSTLDHNQMLSAFRFRRRRPRQASAFDRIMRPQGVALPILGVAAKVTLDEHSKRVTGASIAVGPAGPLPFRAEAAEAILTAAPAADASALAAAVAAVQDEANLRTSRHRATQAYRREMLAVLLGRVLSAALTRARGRSD